MASIRELSREDVETFLNEHRLSSRGQRAFMVALLDLDAGTAAPDVGAETLREELGRRSGGAVSAAAFRKQLSRVNESLTAAEAPFALVTRGSRVAVVPTEHWNRSSQLDSVQRALVTHSGEKMRGAPDSFVPPRAMPDRLLVMWSYAWLKGQQQDIQLEIFDQLKSKLANPPAKYRHLPRIDLWRDEDRMNPADVATLQMDRACEEAFLGLLVFSDLYPHRDACLREADHFLEEDGSNRPDKKCIVLRFNCGLEDVDPRFRRRIVIPLGAEGHLLNKWVKGDEDDRNQLISDIAELIFENADQWCNQPTEPTPPPGPECVRAKDRLQQFMAEQPRRMLHDETHTTPPLARPGAAGYTAANTMAAAEDGGVDIVERLIDWASSKDPSKPRVTALLGDFGMGKTVTCQLVCRRMIDRIESGGGGSLPTPVYFDLRDIPRPERPDEITLEKLFTDLLRRTGDAPPTAQEVIEFIRTRQALVIFDGLDEMTNKYSIDVARIIYRQLLSIVPATVWADDAERRLKRLKGNGGLSEARGGPSILLSCRSQYFSDFAAERGFLSDADRSGLKIHEDIAVYTMLPFTAEQIRDYIDRNLPEADRERALALIETTYDLAELARRPVLLKYIGELVHQLEAEKLAGRTINLARLYDILVRQAFERDAGKHVIPVADKERLLERLALHLHTRQQEEISNERLIEWLDAEIDANFPKLAAARQGAEGLKLSEVFVQDLRNATLLSRPGEGGFRFGHTSLREYFLARALYRTVLAGTASEQWTIMSPSAETLNFLLQRHTIEAVPERSVFEGNFSSLLSPGQPFAVRWLAFSLWRQSTETGRPLPRPDRLDCSDFELNGAQLRGRPSQSLPLGGSIWRGARLRQAEFEDAELAGADFSSADAKGAWFSRCGLNGARFSGALLDGSIWRDCALDAGALESATLIHAEAYNSTLGGEHWSPQPETPASASHWEIVCRSRGGARAFDASEIGDRPVLAIAGGRGIQVIDSRTGAVLRTLIPPSGAVLTLACGRVGDRAVVAGATLSGEIWIWDLDSGELQQTIKQADYPRNLSIGRIGNEEVIVSITFTKSYAWNAKTGTLVNSWDLSSVVQMSVDIAEVPGDLLVAVGSYRAVTIWSVATGKQVQKVDLHYWVKCLCFITVDGRLTLATGGDGDDFQVLDIHSGQQLRKISHGTIVRSLVAIPNGDKMLLASAGRSGPIKLWSPGQGVLVQSVEASDADRDMLKFQMVNGRPTLIAGFGDGVLKVWDVGLDKEMRRLGRIGVSVSGAVPVSVGGRPAIATGGKWLQVISPLTGEVLQLVRTSTSWAAVHAFAMIDDIPVLLMDGENNTLRLHDLSSQKVIRSFEMTRGEYIHDTSLLVIGKEALIIAAAEGGIYAWYAATGKSLPPIVTADFIYTITAGMVDGIPLVFGAANRSVNAWNIVTGEAKPIGISSSLFSPLAVICTGDKSLLAVGYDDGAIHLFDLRAHRIERTLFGHHASVNSLSVITLGQRSLLASTASDGSIRVWDCADGACLSVIERFGTYLPSVALSEVDGRVVIAWIESGVVGTTELGTGTITLAVPGTDSAITFESNDEKGQRLVAAGPDAWKHFLAAYESDGRRFIAGIDDLPGA